MADSLNYVESKVKQARILLLINEPFIGAIAGKCAQREGAPTGIPMRLNGWVLEYNADYVQRATDTELQAAIVLAIVDAVFEHANACANQLQFSIEG